MYVCMHACMHACTRAHARTHTHTCRDCDALTKANVHTHTLDRWGVSFTRWTTSGDLPGGRGSQILDFVTRHLTKGSEGEEVAWAVVDSERLGKGYEEEGALMMEVLLLQQSVLVGEQGYTDDLARATVGILMGQD